MACSSTYLEGWELAMAEYQWKLSPITGQLLLPGGNLYLLWLWSSWPMYFPFLSIFERKVMDNNVRMKNVHTTKEGSHIVFELAGINSKISRLDILKKKLEDGLKYKAFEKSFQTDFYCHIQTISFFFLFESNIQTYNSS